MKNIPQNTIKQVKTVDHKDPMYIPEATKLSDLFTNIKDYTFHKDRSKVNTWTINPEIVVEDIYCSIGGGQEFEN